MQPMTYSCRYCKRSFAKESTLTGHVCERKRRAADQDQKQNRIAFQSWLVWRKRAMAMAKADKTYEDFIANANFIGFMKLSRFIIDLGIDSAEDYVDYLAMKGIAIANWTSDSVYENFIKEKTKKETVERAIERTILNMKAWAEKSQYDYTEYFVRVSAVQAVQDIRMGRISPWSTFASDQGSRLIDRLEPGQVESLVDYLNPKSWRAKVLRQRQDAEWVQQVFNQAEIK